MIGVKRSCNGGERKGRESRRRKMSGERRDKEIYIERWGSEGKGIY